MSDLMSVRLHLKGVRGVEGDGRHGRSAGGEGGVRSGVVEVSALWVPLHQGVGPSSEADP